MCVGSTSWRRHVSTRCSERAVRKKERKFLLIRSDFRTWVEKLIKFVFLILKRRVTYLISSLVSFANKEVN